MTIQDDLPLEVRLARDVRQCQSCNWFWKGTPPYGPYPGFDWLCDYPPEAIAQQPQTAGYRKPWPWLKATFTEPCIVEPGILHGCRMAPIMTVGINPNMTAWFPYSSSAGWCYPAFSKVERYAFYYRHFTLYQESVSAETVLQGIDPQRRILAEEDGKVIGATRGMAHNYMELTVQYDGRPEPSVYEIAFAPDDRWVVLVDRDDPVIKGTLLAGCFAPQAGREVELYENAAGYYQRMIPVLERFAEQTGIPQQQLTVGEDVAQHDMVSCASPGWQSKYDMPQDTLTRHCVDEHGWMVSQFVQSQPKVVILVGGSALSMFRTVFWPFMTLDSDGRDIYQLLEETCKRPTYVDIDIGPVKFKSRLLTPPHFSYSDNFKAQARLSPQAWAAFSNDFAQDADVLEQNHRVYEASSSGFVPIEISGDDDPIRADLSVSGWQVLMAYYLAPYDLLAQALADEERAGNLAFDAATGHLRRSDGPCRFCVNGAWTFPEGCAYGKTELPPNPKGALEEVAQEILARARHKPAAES
jgi:hypothetical protein